MSAVSRGARNGPGGATVCAGSAVPGLGSAEGVLDDVCPVGVPESEVSGAEPAVDDESDPHPASNRTAATAALSRADTPPVAMTEG
jgi:hypothetical protein